MVFGARRAGSGQKEGTHCRRDVRRLFVADGQKLCPASLSLQSPIGEGDHEPALGSNPFTMAVAAVAHDLLTLSSWLDAADALPHARRAASSRATAFPLPAAPPPMTGLGSGR